VTIAQSGLKSKHCHQNKHFDAAFYAGAADLASSSGFDQTASSFKNRGNLPKIA